ncbi:histidinol dehydrogenase [Achromatium sp. WMS2]|nr:histidinol dehydrogenase [Achromatium sp. WMS2]
MANKIQAIRGMHDILPPQIYLWQHVETAIRTLMHCYDYQELRLPIVETTELFKRSIGEVTDIVEKEMYSFSDRNGDGLTLRPEGTASCVRAAIEHGLLDTPRRFWYQGPMFRHERPQRGRYRQFHQLGIEVFGLPGPDIELELILLITRLWHNLGLKQLELQINTLGNPDERANYRNVLVTYLQQNYTKLDVDSQRRLQQNPLRILDSKNPELQDILTKAPILLEYIGPKSLEHLEQLKINLSACNINYTINPRLVRGLDYYTHTVFEWVNNNLGTQGTVCAGGRYDNLVEQLGGRPTTAIGLAMGIERIVAMLIDHNHVINANQLDIYFITASNTAQTQAFIISEQIRDKIPQIRIQVHCGGGSFKSQFKKADRNQARYAMILGDDELTRKVVGIKSLRDQNQQIEVSFLDLINWLQTHIMSQPPSNL